MAEQQIISIDGVGDVEFPDSMSDADIAQAAKALHAQAHYPGAMEMQARSADETDKESQKEPDTFAGGFLKSIKDQTKGVMPALEHAAHPKNVGDFLSLLIPSQVEGAARTAAQYGRALKQGVSEAPSGVAGMMSIPSRAYKALEADMPTAKAAANEASRVENLPRQMGPLTIKAQGGTMPDLVPKATDVPRQMPPLVPESAGGSMPQLSASGASPRLVKSAPTTSLEDELVRTLTEGKDRGSNAPHQTLPPEQTITPGGATRQSGKFGKSGSLGQAGGYTSGRPATSGADWTGDAPASKALQDVIERRQTNRGPLPGINERRMSELLDKFGGRGESPVAANAVAAPPTGAGAPSAAEVADLRRHYGARDAAKMLGITEDEVRRIAPGPSRTPIVAEQRIRDAANKAKQ